MEEGKPCPRPSLPGSPYCQHHQDREVQQIRETSLFVQQRGYIALLLIVLVGFVISWAAGCGDAFVDALVYY
jgi:hypothetical protein